MSGAREKSKLPRTAALSFAAAGLLSLAGCEKVGAGARPAQPLWANRPVHALSIDLRRELTAQERKVGEEWERGRPELDPPNLRLFVGSSDRGLYALKADDGKILWRFETMGAVQSEPLYDPKEDVVYFGSNDGALYKVKASDGQLLWRFSTNAEVSRRPVLANGLLYVVNANDTVMALFPDTGKLRWSRHRTPALGMEIAGYAGPLVTKDRVYAAFSDGHVMAYGADDGSEQWAPVDLAAEAEQLTGDVPKYLDVDTTPVLDTIQAGEVVYVASFAGGVFALDSATGARIWANDRAQGVTELVLWEEEAHRPRDGQGPMIPARKMLLASSGNTGLWALSPEDGREIWRRPLPEGGISAPVPIAGALLVSTTRYGLFLFSPLDGGVIDGIDTTGGFATTPAVHGLRGFVLSNGGTLLGVSVLPPDKL